MPASTDTICAIATPAGRGGISIIRVSGPLAQTCANAISGLLPPPRYAHYGHFYNTHHEIIDTGLTLFFPGPDSFTGEDVVEFQAHGGPFVVDLLLQEILRLGPRIARPGEFSERAFLNDKIDLTQAEAIADLIDSDSTEAARFAVRSMQGEFSRLVNAMIDDIINLRKYVEAAMDFPEEDVDFLSSGDVEQKLSGIIGQLDQVLAQARQGTIMKEGLSVVIAGEPNAGKSSLLNVLAGQSRAIVTEIAGTTRDTLREHINIDGMPLHIIDTAGLHASEDLVEKEGIRRAWNEIRDADLVLLLVDSTKYLNVMETSLCQEISAAIQDPHKIMVVYNKSDISGLTIGQTQKQDTIPRSINVSAKAQTGIVELKEAIKQFAGLNLSTEGGFIARRRHLNALTLCRQNLDAALVQLTTQHAGELVAEDLKLAHQALEAITGSYTADDLLGEIFTSFCIGT